MEFASLEASAPLRAWIEFLRPERVNAAVAVVEKRQSELAKMIGATNQRERGLEAVGYLDGPSAEVQQLCQMAESKERYYRATDEARGRFSHWVSAWWRVQQRVPG